MNCKTTLLFLIFFFLAFQANAQKQEADRAMNKEVEPFRIIGNIYYVGASDVTSYLITTPKGHILIDAGFEETVPQIRQNVAKLGFKLEDVKILLINHAHYDHSGGLARLKQLTGARLFASPPDAPVLEDGGKSDFRFGGDSNFAFAPVKVDKILKNGEIIELGGTALMTLFTFGHTKGATSWKMNVTENKRKYTVVFASSLTTLDYALADNPKYPSVAADFTNTFTALKKIPADVLLSSHGVFFDLTEKAAKARSGAKPNPFVSRAQYKNFIARMEKAFQDKLNQQAKKQK
jgi:metallo-beta-lactamase class B